MAEIAPFRPLDKRQRWIGSALNRAHAPPYRRQSLGVGGDGLAIAPDAASRHGQETALLGVAARRSLAIGCHASAQGGA